jgi:hypothetical protein
MPPGYSGHTSQPPAPSRAGDALPHSRMLLAPGEYYYYKYRRAGIRQRRVSRWQRRVSCTLTASRGTLTALRGTRRSCDAPWSFPRRDTPRRAALRRVWHWLYVLRREVFPSDSARSMPPSHLSLALSTTESLARCSFGHLRSVSSRTFFRLSLMVLDFGRVINPT